MSALPAIETLHPLTLIVAVFVCTFVELAANVIVWYGGKCSTQESTLVDDAALLKVEIAKTNYPDKFVENSRLQRQLIKVDKELEKLRMNRSVKKSLMQRRAKWLRAISYGILLTVYWATVAIKFTPAFVAPLRMVTSVPFQGSGPGAISVAGMIVLFWWGLKGRFCT